MLYLLAFAVAFGVSAMATPWVRRYALDHGIVDRPDGDRKIHTRDVAYLGGVAIFAGFLATSAVFLPITRQLTTLILACFVLVIVGVVDDIRGLSAWHKLGWQFVAASIALAGGIGIVEVNNPLGGVIHLDTWRYAFSFGSIDFHIAPLANAISLLWMVGLANTINFLDGLDGLACGISGIAAVVLFLLSIGPRVGQPAVALLAIILAGAAFGFLPYNFFPARIFMGDSGAYFLGLTLAMVSIYSGAKLATVALVLGVPLLDAIWTTLRRILSGRSPFRADRLHFHHLLLEAGMTQKQAVLVLYAASASLGVAALASGPMAKLIALAALVLVMAGAIAVLLVVGRRHRRAT